MNTVADKPKKARRSHLDNVGLAVLKETGTPPLFSSVAVKPLWLDGAGESMVSYYRVNVYCFTGEPGMVPRIKMNDSYFIKCDKSDNLLTKLEKKYG